MFVKKLKIFLKTLFLKKKKQEILPKKAFKIKKHEIPSWYEDARPDFPRVQVSVGNPLSEKKSRRKTIPNAFYDSGGYHLEIPAPICQRLNLFQTYPDDRGDTIDFDMRFSDGQWYVDEGYEAEALLSVNTSDKMKKDKKSNISFVRCLTNLDNDVIRTIKGNEVVCKSLSKKLDPNFEAYIGKDLTDLLASSYEIDRFNTTSEPFALILDPYTKKSKIIKRAEIENMIEET